MTPSPSPCYTAPCPQTVPPRCRAADLSRHGVDRRRTFCPSPFASCIVLTGVIAPVDGPYNAAHMASKRAKRKGEGRPLGSTKVTKVIKDLFLEALECGLSIDEASHVAGVHRETLRLAAAEDSVFLDSVSRATSRGKFHHLKKVHDGDEKWQASAWMLARKWWREYAARQPDKFTSKDVVGIVTTIIESLLPMIPEKQKQAAHTAVNSALAGVRAADDRVETEEL